MLVIKNLIEVGVQNIINYYRSDFIFEELTMDGWYRYSIRQQQNLFYFIFI